MKKCFTPLLLSFLINLSFSSAWAQMDSVFVSGVVYDYETRETLKKANFKINDTFVELSEDGKFQCYVKPNDSLSVRFLGYDDYVFVIPNDLDKVAYISGIFLNQAEIQSSETLFLPREYNVESLATYDPLDAQRLLQNAYHNVNVAAYQAGQPRQMDAHDNVKMQMGQKEMEIEYKNAISPAQQVGFGAYSTLQNGKIGVDKLGQKGIGFRSFVSPQEEYFLNTLFDALVLEESTLKEDKSDILSE